MTCKDPYICQEQRECGCEPECLDAKAKAFCARVAHDLVSETIASSLYFAHIDMPLEYISKAEFRRRYPSVRPTLEVSDLTPEQFWEDNES